MKITYLILFLFLAFNTNAENILFATAELPVDSARSELKMQKIKKDFVISERAELKPVTPKLPSGNDKRARVPATAPKSTQSPKKESTQERKDENRADSNSVESKIRFELSSNGNTAYFPGGERAIRDFIRKNRRYPEECKSTRANGKVIVSITIAPDGTPGNIHIASSSGNKYMDEEALRVASLMPKWKAAKNVNEGEERIYRMSITFRPGR